MLVETEFYLIYVDVEETVLKMYRMAEIRCNSFTEISDTGASQAGTSDIGTSFSSVTSLSAAAAAVAQKVKLWEEKFQTFSLKFFL